MYARKAYWMKLFSNKLIIFVISILVTSCLPEVNSVRELGETSQDTTSGNAGDDAVDGGISENNFFQQASTSTTSTLTIAADFNDSFLMRGDNINEYIAENVAGTDKRLCMAISFPLATGTGSHKVLVMAARVRNYYNNKIGSREYYLQMEPQNVAANSGDCLNVNLSSTLSNNFGFSTAAYSSSDICPQCNVTLASSKIIVMSSASVVIPQVDLGNLALGIKPAQGSSGNVGLTCSADSVCKVEGYDCCLANQCVNHAETRSGVDTASSGYLSALDQVTSRPETITSFTEYFYVCPQLVPDDSEDPLDPADPIQQADDLYDELEDLYNCYNPSVDEFAICSSEEFIDLDAIGTGGTTVSAGTDDLNFSSLNSAITYNNIYNIEYAGQLIYQQQLLSTDTATALPSEATLTSSNDDLTSAQSATVDKTIPPDATKDIVKVRFLVDGTCERLGTNLARCEKYYTQGQSSTPVRSSDHTTGDNSFKIPSYADLNYNVIVEVNNVRIATGTDTWSIDTTNYEVDFNYTIYDDQEIAITYFVTSNVDAIMSSREAALEQIITHCKCDADLGCNLSPVTETINDEEVITNYECEYPQPDVPDAPLQETVYITSKTVPHRYYDEDGVHYEYDEIGDGQAQEGTAFSYTANNSLKPNNQTQYIGFNEIYGSFDRTEISAMPATVVDIDKGVQYDIFVDSGSFSSCLNCGTDYFSNLQKLFPNNFTNMGGGYLPDMVESRLRQNQGKYSAFDMKFGRACFVPATMIPWTHQESTDVNVQRADRLAAQHFLFANGYNKDWYGFDYGSLIGSYDGVKWFSVGNQRRIQAKSNKLYLAINAYFGDLTIDTTFKVTVSELSTIINSGSEITHDTDSDGAECQQAHFCDTDNDCIAQLGYEYTCQSVSGIYTPWPVFDNDGNEQAGSVDVSLLSLVGGSNGQVKRCVYRGSGSLCQQDLSSVAANSSYAQSSNEAIHACAPNTYCAELTDSVFNDRIARYGDTPARQNNQSYITDDIGEGDTFGLGARIIGRPFDFLGSEDVPSNILSHLSGNNVTGMCVPGKGPIGASTVNDLNEFGAGVRAADKSLGIGKTYPEYVSQNPAYFSACPTVDKDGIFTHNADDRLTEALSSTAADSHSVLASSQNMSTNSMKLTAFDSLELFNDEDATITEIGYNEASCLRAAGSSCFTDMDCSPNSWISQKVKTLSNLTGVISSAEEAFWEEELVCANTQDRYLTSSIYPNPAYELTEHKCCRETDKTFTFASQKHMESDFRVIANDDPSSDILLPGINQSITSSERYSRTHTTYDKMVENRTEYPPLYTAGTTLTNTLTYADIDQIYNQYNTLHLNNSRMCCTGHWVRNFSDSNGGGHKFNGSVQQNIPKSTFKTLNWNEETDPITTWPVTTDPYECSAYDYNSSNCEIKDFAEGGYEETKWLEWFGKFELIGIPQVLIENNFNAEYYNPLNELQEDNTALMEPLPNTIKNYNDDSFSDVTIATDGTNQYYSAASYDNFEIGGSKLKKVFSEDEFSCCIPTGVQIDGSTDNSACCSGQVNTENAGSDDEYSRCCLNDFTDLSVYTNRYVSSEGAYLNGQEISASDIDEAGYVKKEIVMQMAATMCCSGQAAYGVAVGDYFIPTVGDVPIQNAKTRRFLYLETFDDANEVDNGVSNYNQGLKWNNHVYCVPADSSTGSTGSSN